MNKILLIFFLVTSLISCVSAPPVQYYVLESLKPKVAIALEKPHTPVTVGVGPVTIPSLLDRNKLVTRAANNSVQIAEFHQWATPLQDNITEILVSNLTNLQPNSLFRAYPWSVYGVVDVQIIVDIQRFDATPGKSVNLEANWTIKNEKSRILLKTGRTVLQQPLLDPSYSGMVQGLSQLLGTFCQELNTALLIVDTDVGKNTSKP